MDPSQHSNPEHLKALARETAIALGAADVRVADANGAERTQTAMRQAFARGDFSTWPYDEEYARKAASPDTIMPGAKSVISVAVPYRTAPVAESAAAGRVSNYAWSFDYHRRVKTLLQRVASEIDRAAGSPVTAVACDTKPIAERAFAARAGLGWIGKHTNLITPLAGSYVFLGEIVTTIRLPADPPLRKTCGSCSRCIPACPTGALRGDYTIDATRCISDLTQRTDPIPRALRPLIGQWVWGCDLCQVACPPNARAKETGTGAFEPLARQTAAPDLVRLLNLRSGEFKRTYARSAMGWRGAAVLRRNAAVALGNALDRAAVPALAESLLRDPNGLVRGHVAWALGRIGSPRALQALRDCRHGERDPFVLEEVSAALEPFGPAKTLQPI
ncbi:MAG TPA: tRNA epoxyqueuosine(34) reductase QueG [Candidatus Baltobacteraceae bacterium]|jgi:epoxyqueuosine reductase|nr:tRNA epoxyqueuosine(34) reductase QueG [Candidatus Baltobacteraceae bacterium]